jgi:hypothetical protein
LHSSQYACARFDSIAPRIKFFEEISSCWRVADELRLANGIYESAFDRYARNKCAFGADAGEVLRDGSKEPYEMNADEEFSEEKFIGHFVQNAKGLMWFLGAGTSRTAGMPTATDIIWDLKRKYYCLQENQQLQTHDLNNRAIQDKIQQYLDGKKFPALWSPEEYSFYFDLTFGGNYEAQRKYIHDLLDSKKISLNIGHRAFAGLMAMGLLRVAFTTNFEDVIETALSAVAGKNLSSFHLEGSYAALAALNAEQFPIYAKIHGDLSADLLHNDQEIQKCFLAAATRFGIVVTGYSGRDANVMAMFRAALEQNNPFPQGMFWTVTRKSGVAHSVLDLIAFARSKGVTAHIVETGTFDIMLSKIWRQIPGKPLDVDLKVRTAKANPVSIPLPVPGKNHPLLRTNALAVTALPEQCGTIDYGRSITFPELKDKIFAQKPNAVVSYTDRILFWGDTKAVCGLLQADQVKSVQMHEFAPDAFEESTILKSFLEQALAESLCAGKPLLLRRKSNTPYLVIAHNAVADLRLEPLRQAVGYKGPGELIGPVPKLDKTFWAESLSMSLEFRNKKWWLLIEPELWISPLTNREHATDFIREKRLRRYNKQSSQILDAWISLLLGATGDNEVAVSCFPNAEFKPAFTVNARTAFSRGGGV